MSEDTPDKTSGEAKGEEPAPYELLPTEPAPVAEPAPKAKLEGPRFIDTVDDDADLSDDGTARLVRGGSPLSRENTTVNAAAVGAFVEAGRGDAPIVAAVGAGVCVAACVCAAVFAKDAKFASAVLALLYIVIQTVCGVAGVGVTAHLVGRSFGDVLLGAARIFLAVSLLWLALSVGFEGVWKFVKPLVGAGMYAMVLWATMRRSWRDIAKVGVMHFLLSVAAFGVFIAFAWAWGATGAKP